MSAPSSAGRPSWAVPAAIVVGLVLGALVLGLLLRGGDDPAPAARSQAQATPTATATPMRPKEGTIRYAQGRAIELGATREQVERRLGPPAPPAAGFPQQSGGAPCIYYRISDQPQTRYQFCFDQQGRSIGIATVFPQPGS